MNREISGAPAIEVCQRYNPRHKFFTNYDVFHGLQSKEFNGQACYKSLQGELFFGGINGLNAFFPDQVKDNPYQPRIIITGLRIFNEPVAIASPFATPAAYFGRERDRADS